MTAPTFTVDSQADSPRRDFQRSWMYVCKGRGGGVAVNKVLIKLLTNAETATRRLCLPSAESRHLGAHHKWRAHDTKRFHLEIYRQRLLFSSTPGLATLTCSPARLHLKCKKVSTTHLPPPPRTSLIFLSPSNSQCAVYCAENIKGL